MTSNAGKLDGQKRRLVRTLYRSMVRFCNELHPSTPLNQHHILPFPGKKSIENVETFREALKQEFRTESPQALSERIQRAIQGLKKLNEIQPDLLKSSRQWGDRIERHKKMAREETGTSEKGDDNEPSNKGFYDEITWVRERLESISWLPKLEECEPGRLVDPYQDIFPIFPLRGALFHPEGLIPDDELIFSDRSRFALPLFTSPQDVPVPGMEVPLQIFEPRYRELYSDLQNSGKRQVIVPFAHPLIPGCFARYALIHQLTDLEEIADETNGKVQYIADHVVTQPVYIDQILNPQVWTTKETYLRVQGRIMEDEGVFHDVLEPLHDILNAWKNASSHPLAAKSLTALQGEGLWALVHVWNSHFQQELLQLQLAVATQIKHQEGVATFFLGPDNRSTNVPAETIVKAQEPHRRRIVQLMMDSALLVPTLLSLDGIGKCQHLVEMVERERNFQNTNSFTD